MAEENDNNAESTTTTVEFVQEDGITIVPGGMKVEGNLEVSNQTTTKGLKVADTTGKTVMLTDGAVISFRKACEFQDSVKFNGGKTIIGIETTYNSAYVGSTTIQAGSRLVVGDSLLKITASDRKILADTFRMTLSKLKVGDVVSKTDTSDLVVAKNVKVSGEFIGNSVYADTIKTNSLYLESISGINLKAADSLTTKDLIVGGNAVVQNDITIRGIGVTGAALTVNGGQIIANKGISSHTRNNLFQCLKITGSGADNDVCFKVDRGVGSLFEGDVTVQNSSLVLDQSRLITDDITVASMN